MRRRALLPAFIAVGVIAFTAGAIVASSVGLKVWTDPDIGLTEAERRAAQDQNSAEFWARYELWLDEQKKLGVDMRSYPVTELLASVAEPAPNLTEAVRQAELIVSGTVEGVEFRPTADALVRINVADTTKGVSGETVDVILPNALMPDDEWKNPQIGVVEAMPMVYPGERVVLFSVL